MTRVDFGWWSFVPPRKPGHRLGATLGTQADLWEYAVSVATAWDCAASINMMISALDEHPRTDDILGVMRRWADARRRGLFREEWREELKDVSHEHHLLATAGGGYDLVRWHEILHGDMERPVRAFFFEKDGYSWVAYWHCSGEGRLRLPLPIGDVALYDEFAGRPVQVDVADGGVSVPAGKMLYLRSRLGRAALESAFKSSSACGQ